jgi:hypothetical protein
MTAADAIFSSFADSIVVSRRSRSDGSAYVYTFYFEGEDFAGNVMELDIVDGCSDVYPSSEMFSNTFVSVVTLVEGGFTEIQDVRLNVDAGYIEGGFFELGFSSERVSDEQITTGCIPFGADAAYVQAALQQLASNKIVPFNVSIGSENTTLTASSSIYGILEVGTVVNIPFPNSTYYKVTGIDSGFQFRVFPPLDLTVGEWFRIFVKVDDSILVGRYGTGNSTATVLTITQTADEYVNPLSKGFFKIRMSYGGMERTTDSCLPYHSTAAEVQEAINSLKFDFNGDGGYTTSDRDHIIVSRSGDGSVSSGYGYVYTIRFSGPVLAYGRSDVMGASRPTIAIIDEGHYGGCQDLNSTFIDTIVVEYSSSVGSTVWTLATVSGIQLSPLGVVEPGNRLRLPAAPSPYKSYLVIAVSEYTITVDSSLPIFPSSPSKVYANLIKTPLPEHTVETAIEGEDSYLYRVFFSGPHLSNVEEMTISVCRDSGFEHFNGMRYGATVSTSQQGGSLEVQVLQMSSIYPIVEDVDGYFKLEYEGVIVRPVVGSFTWGVSASTISNAIYASINRDVTVTRTGSGAREEDYRYIYSLTFNAADSEGTGNIAPFNVLLDQSISTPIFISGNGSYVKSGDLVPSGKYNGSFDAEFHVIITNTSTFGDMFTWTLDGDNVSTYFAITASVAFYLDYGIYVSFNSNTGHNIGDTWIFYGVRTNLTLPDGAEIFVTELLSGTPDIRQLTVSPTYAGAASESVYSYIMPPVFSVLDQSVNVWKLMTNNPDIVNQSSLVYQFQLNSKYVDVANSSECLNWNAEDYEVEAALTSPKFGLCDDELDCLTVTRSIDNVNNLGGYVYSIYFDGSSFVFDLPSDFFIIHQTECGTYDNSSLPLLKKVMDGLSRTVFTESSIPLAAVYNVTLPKLYRGQSVNRVPIYKVRLYVSSSIDCS